MKDQISFVETPHVSSSTLAGPPRSYTPPSPVKSISASISSLHGDCSPAGPAASPTLTTLTLAADSLASHSDSATIPVSISASQYNPDTMWQAGIDASCAAPLQKLSSTPQHWRRPQGRCQALSGLLHHDPPLLHLSHICRHTLCCTLNSTSSARTAHQPQFPRRSLKVESLG